MARSSSYDDQTPVPSPAMNAAPSAVVSTISGRSTGTPSWSAWIWQSRSFAAAPPSTRSDDTERSGPIGLDHVAHLERDRLQRRAHDVRRAWCRG